MGSSILNAKMSTIMTEMKAKNIVILVCLLNICSTHAWSPATHILMASSSVHLNQADMAMTVSVNAGAQIAIDECQHQFRNDLWSCPKDAFMLDPHVSSTSNIFNNDSVLINDSKVKRRVSGDYGQRQTNRETAFVHAIVAAGITHTLTKNCSRGDIPDCFCDTRDRNSDLEWKLRGCSDNVHFGSQVAQQLLDATEAGADSASMANLHNNEAGRVAVKKNMRELCKCHGVSGSCATKTCWKQISDFRQVSDYLKKMYKQALKIHLANTEIDRPSNEIANRLRESSESRKSPQLVEQIEGTYTMEDGTFYSVHSTPNVRGARSNRNRRKSRSESRAESKKAKLLKKLKKRRLVFLDESPDYCRPNSTAGFPGIIGRYVTSEPGSESGNRGSNSGGGGASRRRQSRSTRHQFKKFRQMCEKCGFKIKRQVQDVSVSCQCRFHWCCKVECNKCWAKRTKLTCVLPR